MAQNTVDDALGAEYFERFRVKDPIRPTLRSVTERILPAVFRQVFGKLEVIYDDESVRDGDVRIWTANHRSEALDVNYVMAMCADANAPWIRPVMKAPHARAKYAPFFHAEGGIAVGRGSTDKEYLLSTMDLLSARGYSPFYFTEGFRVKSKDRDGNPQDTRKVHGVKPGAVALSLATNLELVPTAIAGIADNDVRRRNIPIVAVVGAALDPLDFKHLPEATNVMAESLLERQQDALERAYNIRDNYIQALGK